MAANIRLGWMRLTVVSTLAYYTQSTKTAVKCFTVQDHGANAIKPFTVVIYEFSKLLARVFVPGKPFQPSQMFAGKAVAYPSEEPLRCPVWGRLLALPTNIRLCWKGLPRTNTLANCENL
jgi:hypothetical protein